MCNLGVEPREFLQFLDQLALKKFKALFRANASAGNRNRVFSLEG